MKIIFIDLDGVVANSDARFERALVGTRVDWKIAFDPDLVPLDTLIDGADLVIKHLEALKYTVYFLTSRPEAMRAATEVWLAQYGLQSYKLIMKPVRAQFTKTTIWKADIVREIANLPDTKVIFFVDDEEANCRAVEDAVNGVVCVKNLEDLKDL
jgi:phosphoglycolate phosphatase-like HAD superfamily hydrolase